MNSRDGREETYAENNEAQSVMPSAIRVAAVMLFAVCVGQSQSIQTGPASPSESGPKPLLLEKNEGEQRIWRDPPPGAFMLKVSPENNGSQHLVLVTEDLQPGDAIPRHQHLGQDEIVLIEAGTAHVQVGDQQRDLHAGGLVFIPAYTWVSLRNNSNEPTSIGGHIFSARLRESPSMRFGYPQRESYAT